MWLELGFGTKQIWLPWELNKLNHQRGGHIAKPRSCPPLTQPPPSCGDTALRGEAEAKEEGGTDLEPDAGWDLTGLSVFRSSAKRCFFFFF